MDVEPKFLKCKYKLSNLIKVYDYQLRYHFLNLNNLYVTTCSCTTHRHNKIPCTIVDSVTCQKCQKPTTLLMNYGTLLMHGSEFMNKEIYTCCEHIHKPPCGRCLYCNTIPLTPKAINQYPCAIKSEFSCVHTSAVVCPKHKDKFTNVVDLSKISVQDHIYNTNCLIFYFCKTHAHKHTDHFNDVCYINTFKCCDDAVYMKNYTSSFIVMLKEPILRRGLNYNKDKTKYVKYIIYDPRIWLDASFNHFVSFIRAVIAMPNMAKKRYERFETSNFSVSNIKKYKSGKESMVRLAITGFETKGVYQTSTISCLIPRHVVKIPQKLYDLLQNKNYDLSYVCIKRDPSIKSTCMFVCKAERNEDEDCETLIIPDEISKPMHQDQDGDKNAIYLLPLIRKGYDFTQSYLYKLSKFEMSQAFQKPLTLIATPRYQLSETNLLHIYRSPEKFEDLPFARRTLSRGPEFVIGAGCGYLKDEYPKFLNRLIEINKSNDTKCVTLDDLLLKTDRLPSMVNSEAKGSKEFIFMLLSKISNNKNTLTDNIDDMFNLVNKYITSSRELSQDGRNHFISIYASNDIVIINGCVFHNTVFVCDLNPCASIAPMIWTDASLVLFTEDLLNL